MNDAAVFKRQPRLVHRLCQGLLVMDRLLRCTGRATTIGRR